MAPGYLGSYVPLLIHILVAIALGGLLLALSALVGPHRPSLEKAQAYECGMLPIGDARHPFDVKFYLVGISFVLFDVETVFFLTWAYAYRELGTFGFYVMLVYIVILAVGYVYELKQGLLDWNK